MNEYDGAETERVVLSNQVLRNLSTRDFAQLGNQVIAYLRPVVLNGAPAFSIHAADGTQIGAAPNALLAAAAIRQHEMEPALVH
jgi:hypothetical protein